MKFERIPLSSEDESVYMDAYIADRVGAYTRKALLVIPGGGYGNVCSEREGEPIAMAFMPHGYNAFVLHYTVGRKQPFPVQLIEVARAIAHIKTNAETYNIDPEAVFVVGFSAGGHLAASAGVLWKLPEVQAAVDMPYGQNKPTGVMLIYPVISAEYHSFSFNNLLCDDAPTKDMLDAVSIEKHVDGDSAPAFIMHTANDQVVDVKNALSIAWGYADAGVPHELHVYPDAPHGAALGNDITECGVAKWNNPAIAQWVNHAVAWANALAVEK